MLNSNDCCEGVKVLEVLDGGILPQVEVEIGSL